MEDLINKFILLGKKAKVLTGVESDIEPRVSVLAKQDGSITYTFNSTCFPFFKENGFETVDSFNVNTFLEKCELYINNLEKSVDISSINKDDSYKPTPIKFNKKSNKNKSAFLFRTKDKKFRIVTQSCDRHLNSLGNTRYSYKKCACKDYFYIEELGN